MLVLFAGSSYSQNLSDLHFGTDSTLDVVTWNLEWFPKNNLTTIDCVTTIVQAMDADVIAFQEIDDSLKFQELIDALPAYSGVSHRTLSDHGGLAYLYKNSLTVISSCSIYDNSSYWAAFPRAPFVLRIEYEAEDVFIINHHLKCCGDGYLDTTDTYDEENRRLQAMGHMKNYIDQILTSQRVIMLGDFNDLIQEPPNNNVFQSFIDDTVNHKFVDMGIAQGSAGQWSYPNWPSHLDHIMISHDLVLDWAQAGSYVECFEVDDFLPNGWWEYENKISDHRPVGMRITVTPNIGLEEAVDQKVKLYPNPASEYIRIQFEENSTFTSAALYNIQGNQIWKRGLEPSNNMEIVDLRDQPAGMYFIKFRTSSGEELYSKFVIK